MYLEKMFGLNGKVAIVTGGGRGIGQVIAQGLAEAGAEVVILSRSGAEETVKLITEAGGKAGTSDDKGARQDRGIHYDAAGYG